MVGGGWGVRLSIVVAIVYALVTCDPPSRPLPRLPGPLMGLRTLAPIFARFSFTMPNLSPPLGYRSCATLTSLELRWRFLQSFPSSVFTFFFATVPFCLQNPLSTPGAIAVEASNDDDGGEGDGDGDGDRAVDVPSVLRFLASQVRGGSGFQRAGSR